LKIITGDIWELLQAARLAEKGILPLPGGWLDQTQWFVEAVDFVWGEQSVAKAETMRGFSNGI
jgi:hypothetical protein